MPDSKTAYVFLFYDAVTQSQIEYDLHDMAMDIGSSLKFRPCGMEC